MAGETGLAEAENKQTEIRKEGEQEIGTPSSESKKTYSAAVTVIGQGGKERPAGPFVFKELHSLETVEKHLKHFRFLKEHGFPVPATMRRIKGENRLMITDLSEGGGKRVVSLNNINAGEVAIAESLQNLSEIKEQLKQVAKKADNLGILIAPDAYFLILDATNKGKLVIGDLGGIMIDKSDIPPYYGYQNSFEAAEGFYRTIASCFSGGNPFPDTTF
jgi:hypothetical protein